MRTPLFRNLICFLIVSGTSGCTSFETSLEESSTSDSVKEDKPTPSLLELTSPTIHECNCFPIKIEDQTLGQCVFVSSCLLHFSFQENYDTYSEYFQTFENHRLHSGGDSFKIKNVVPFYATTSNPERKPGRFASFATLIYEDPANKIVPYRLASKNARNYRGNVSIVSRETSGVTETNQDWTEDRPSLDSFNGSTLTRKMGAAVLLPPNQASCTDSSVQSLYGILHSPVKDRWIFTDIASQSAYFSCLQNNKEAFKASNGFPDTLCSGPSYVHSILKDLGDSSVDVLVSAKNRHPFLSTGLIYTDQLAAIWAQAFSSRGIWDLSSVSNDSATGDNIDPHYQFFALASMHQGAFYASELSKAIVRRWFLLKVAARVLLLSEKDGPFEARTTADARKLDQDFPGKSVEETMRYVTKHKLISPAILTASIGNSSSANWLSGYATRAEAVAVIHQALQQRGVQF